MTATTHLRWLAVIHYRTEASLTKVSHAFEELHTLHSIIEHSPDWNCIEGINIRLNPRRSTHPGDTIERAKKR